MDEYGLGPNGAMLYCMEYLEKNFDWLEEGLNELQGGYFIFDIAGQVSLFLMEASQGCERCLYRDCLDGSGRAGLDEREEKEAE